MESMEHVRLALILAVQADIEAMKLRNEQVGIENVEVSGYPPEHFFQKAEELRNLAHTHINQLLAI